MQANTVRLNLTQDTLDQIVQEALPILKVLGFELEGGMTLKARTASIVNLEHLVQKIQITDIEPHILWK